MTQLFSIMSGTDIKYIDDADRDFICKYAVRIPTEEIGDVFGYDAYYHAVAAGWYVEAPPFKCVGICMTGDGEWYVETTDREDCTTIEDVKAAGGFSHTRCVSISSNVRETVMRDIQRVLDEASEKLATLKSAFNKKFGDYNEIKD